MFNLYCFPVLANFQVRNGAQINGVWLEFGRWDFPEYGAYCPAYAKFTSSPAEAGLAERIAQSVYLAFLDIHKILLLADDNSLVSRLRLISHSCPCELYLTLCAMLFALGGYGPSVSEARSQPSNGRNNQKPISTANRQRQLLFL